ncbi:MAG: hypothetical protein UZ22_OP11002000436 [Microgenomates bacterium OLB23]|nr:MAG: hypothetical protein UZ22_OP11002000436 [Microgenomates bacterium OLB23]
MVEQIGAQSDAFGERIDVYDVHVTVNKDGTLHVIENIQYNFAALERHGIRRWIPLRLNEGEKQYEIALSNVHVAMDNGVKVPVKIATSDGVAELKIGDPKRVITGKHTYEIRYTIGGGMRYSDVRDELYWNAVGQQWEVPILSAVVSVTYPSSVDGTKINTKCFTGVSGSIEEQCKIYKNNGRIDFESNRVLNPQEGLTIAVGLPPGSVDKLLPKEYIPFNKTPLGKLLISLGIVLGSVLAVCWYIVYPIWIVVRWFIHGRDPDVGIDPTAHFNGPMVNAKISFSCRNRGAY